MSDARKLPQSSVPPPGKPGAPAGKPGGPPSSPQVRAVTSPGMRVMSAARAAPVQEEPQGPLGKRLASAAQNAALNGWALLKEFIEDFRERDRFFKFKVFIVGGWLTLSAFSLVIACPGQSLESGALGARVVDPRIPGRPTLMVYNESDEPWEDVVFIVNDEYRASVEVVKPRDSITLTPKQLMSSAGVAPADMALRHLELRTRAGRAKLLRDGQPVH